MLKNNPLVSVIIPAYNHELYIAECLKSVVDNDFKDIEIIILDDGSTDKTFIIASEWLEKNSPKNIKVYLERQENLGLAKTLNRLISLSRGEFIVLLASDDKLTVDSISIRLRALKNNPSWLAVFGNCHIIDEYGNIRTENGIGEFFGGNVYALLDRKSIVKELILKWSVPGPVTMARRAAYELPYDTSLIVEDRLWYLNLLAKNAVGFISHSVAYYRIHSTNTVVNPTSRRRLLVDLAKSECKSVCGFHGIDKFFLLCVYHRSLAIAEYHVNSRMINSIRLFLNKLIVRLLYEFHSSSLRFRLLKSK